MYHSEMQFSWEWVSQWVYAEPSQVFTYDSFLFKSRVKYEGPWMLVRWRLVDEATGEELDSSPVFLLTGEFDVRFPHSYLTEYGVPCLIVAPSTEGVWRLRAEVVDVLGSVLSSYSITVKVASRDKWKYEWTVIVVKPEEYRTFRPEDFIARLRAEYPSIRGVKVFFHEDVGTVEVWVEVQSGSIPVWFIWLVKVIIVIIIAIVVARIAEVLLIIFGRLWICPICGKGFTSWGELKMHKMREHPDEWSRYGSVEEESAREIISSLQTATGVFYLALTAVIIVAATPIVHDVVKAVIGWRRGEGG